MKRVVLLPLLAVVAALGCAGQLPPPSEADALRASSRYPGTTVADLTRGRKLYVEHCSGCHALVRPQTKGPDEWPKLVAEMTERAKLPEATAQEIVRYLVVASGAPR
ncbi:MAG TPA: cytochrome c [Polyangia bacterium]|nr:cytochrome c [Polyangia bacterium]